MNPRLTAALAASGALWSQTCVFAQIHTPAQSLLLIASDQGLPSLRDTADGHPPTNLAELPGSLRPLLRRPAADPALAAQLALDRIFVLEQLDDAQARQAEAILIRSGLCEGIAPDPVGVQSADSSWDVPTDSLFPLQYALHNHGQEIGGQQGRPRADIRAMEAWAISKGAPEVTVAVFDAGVSQSHPDLATKLVPGWNFQHDSSNTDDPYTSHGTHCGGIIAAMSGNRRGVAAIGWRCLLMPVVVLNKYGFGSESTLAEALVWAADQGVPVASVSLGYDPTDGGADDITLHAAVQYATQRGMLICASSGNVPSDRIAAPARYPETIAVGATDNRDQLWPGTSTGPELTVVAPGVDIVSTWDTNGAPDTYQFKTGTSQACPHVAGVAALVRSINPRLTPEQTRSIIQNTCEDLGPNGWDPQFGFGRLNAAAAARAAKHSIGHDPGSTDRHCIADFNGDHLVDTRDFILYLDMFESHGLRADLAEPFGVWDTLDFLAFLGQWAAGCE